MNDPIAVITVPLNEWQETKDMIKSLCAKVSKLTDKEENELLTPKEVCEILKIGRNTYQRYVANGTLEPIKVNRQKNAKVYIKRSELQKLIDDGVFK